MECKFCGSHDTLGREYQLTPCDYDGISEWECLTCHRRWGRWSGRELVADQLEPRYGIGDLVVAPVAAPGGAPQ